MPDLFKNKIFSQTFFLIILAELLSFLGYYYHLINYFGFFIMVILTIFLTLFKLEYGLYILLTELFIGSFGYLFYFDLNGNQISLRLALWLIIMSVWLAKTFIEWLKTKRFNLDFLTSRRLAPIIVLIIFIVWGSVNGLINHNLLNNIFFDANNWLYFLLIFPVLSVWRDNGRLAVLKPIFLAAITWLSVKTIILVYIFTHNSSGINLEIYAWMRADRLGEITATSAGFSRIFMQSHIFILIGFFILLFYLLQFIFDNANKIVIAGLTRNPGTYFNHQSLDSGSKAGMTKYLVALTLFLAAIIISFSRSFWLGLAAGGLFVWLMAWFKLKIKFKQFIIYNSIIFFTVILSILLTLAAVKFPYPRPYGFNPADLFSERVTRLTTEAGASSRWQLLPPLWQKIKDAPILGQGFGTTVTYKSSDPRILENQPDGLYTTYSFEWGWLDIWLKLGLFGLLAYLILLIKIIGEGIKLNTYFSLSLTTGLIVLMAVNIFSPYLNHPLGISYVIMTLVMMKNAVRDK